MEKIEKENLASFIIDLAKKKGANEIAVNLVEERGVSLQYRDGEIEQLHESQQSGISVQIYLDHKFSSHSTNDLRKASVEKFIENAVHSTKYLTPDQYRELPDSKYYPEKKDVDLKLTDKNYENITTKERLELLKQIYESAKKQSDKIISVAAGYSDSITSSLKAHSNGFLGHRTSTMFSAGSETTVRDNDSRPEDWYYASSHYFKDIPGPEILGMKSALGALSKIGQSKIKSGLYQMIVENRAAIRLISMLLSPMSAAAIQQKSSYMDGLIDTVIATEKLTIIDKPFIEKGLGSRLYDGEGIASKERIVVEKGILKQFFVDNYYGKKMGMEPNGGSSSNLVFDVGNQSLDSLIKSFGTGIMITGFNGGNSNTTTGDFSFGISGFWFENGKIVKPISEMNISGNAKKFWEQLVELGNDPYPYSSIMVPSLVFKEISFSGA